MLGFKLVSVVVTFNRLEKLQKALLSYDLQTQQCDDLVVIDNCSTDGTDVFLENWKREPSKYNKHVLSTESNIGGAGGFYRGMEYAMKLKADWVWLADDDAYPEKNSFERLYNFISKQKNIANVSAVCSSVITPAETIDLEHRGYLSRGICWNRRNSNASDYQLEFFNIDFLSYVGVAVNAKALAKVGLCNKDFFIHFDDSEHSIRLRKYGSIFCVPSIRVVHDVPVKPVKANDRNYNWKTYYGIRNTIYSYLRHHIPTACIWILRIVIWQNFLFFTGRINRESRKLMMTAVRDGCKGNLGIHNLYKPGFKFN